MDVRWLRQGGADQVVVVFGGWGVGPSAFEHLGGAQDVLFVDDYRDLVADLPDLSGYARRNLVAWSFGVASYAHWQLGRPDPFQRKIALSGALTPVHRTTGIPPSIFRATLDALSLETYQDFLTRAFGCAQPHAAIDVVARRDELAAVAARGDAPATSFDRIWIGNADKIFPPANLTRAWSGQAVRHVDAPHACFMAQTSWDEVLA